MADYTIQELREQNNLTIEELSQATGVKTKVIENIEKGMTKRVYAKDVCRLGVYFGTCKIKGLTT